VGVDLTAMAHRSHKLQIKVTEAQLFKIYFVIGNQAIYTPLQKLKCTFV
jgi:hypothetical protein